MRFIVDANAGKLVKWLRLIGYDAWFFDGADDAELISTAFKEARVILTRDIHIMEWGIVSSGQVKAILIRDDNAEMQVRQVILELKLKTELKPFTICLECNELLRQVNKVDIERRVPSYVFQTQDQFVECPKCHRVYWRGTHWQGMLKKLEKLVEVDHYQ
jgi:uncharacterized protein with PIN domain